MRNNKELNNIIAEAVNEGFKDIIKKGVKKVGSAIKQEWDELNDIDKIMSAPNPMYLGDPEDLEDLGDYDVDESLRRFIKESVRQALNGCLKENRDYDFYNPWMTGDASYFRGKYDINGYHVEIDELYNVLIQNGEDEYFLQGDEADDLIYDMCLEWENNPNKSQEEIIYAFIQQY